MDEQRPLTEPEQAVVDGGKPPEPGTPEHRIFEQLVYEGIVNEKNKLLHKGKASE